MNLKLQLFISFIMASVKADPSLLSLLEKTANPLQSLKLTTTVRGVFAAPEQWKLSDEANPNTFTYTLQIFHAHYSAGKIQPRKLTEKQIKEQEEAKNKKGSKKQSKEEEKPVQIDPLAQQKRIQWEALSQQEKFHRTQEDPFKAFSLVWAEFQKNDNLDGQNLQKFQSITSGGKLEIVLIRKPDINEQEIAKLKKAKPKTLNLGQLYAAKYHGTIDLSALNHPGSQKIVQRVALSFGGQLPAECIRIDAQKCYALVQIELDQPLNPLVEEVKPSAEQILGEKKVEEKSGSLLARLCQQVRRGARAISQQYSNFFSKEKEHGEQKKFGSSANTSLLNVSTLRINQINKRKEQFLAEFITSGKYTLLRERVLKTMKAIIIDKCRKEKTGSGVTKEQLQKTLSELNVFFREALQKTLDEVVQTESGALHEDLVLSHQYCRSARKMTVGAVGESRQERQVRLAGEYESINRLPQAEEKYLNLVLLHEQSLHSLQNYARFCLRNGKFDQAFALYTRINQNSNEFKHKLILSIFQLHRNREREAIASLGQLDKAEGVSAQERTTIHLMLSFVHERLGQQKKMQKHLALAEKYHQLRHNPHLQINPPRNPYLDPVPRVPKPGKFVSSLTDSESQQIRLSLISFLIDYGFHQIAKDYIIKINEGERKKHIQTLILVAQGKYDEALYLGEELIDKDRKSIELLLLKADICFRSQRMFECEEIFLFILKLKPNPTQAYSIYLRLGMTYLNRKSYEDAKATFNRALELRNNSSIGWLGLGIANLQLGLLQESEEAFNLSSIYNPLSDEPKQYLAKISEQIDRQNEVSYKYLQKAEA